ncbi:MAG TPA: hypothetical protein VFV66_09145 [Nonomuraea sp.]|nr:hypothetical protein [Nonomuraea sp.]
MTAWPRTRPEDRRSVWRDIAVRRRPVDVHDHFRAHLADLEAAA